jgi:hypothetical protein
MLKNICADIVDLIHILTQRRLLKRKIRTTYGEKLGLIELTNFLLILHINRIKRILILIKKNDDEKRGEIKGHNWKLKFTSWLEGAWVLKGESSETTLLLDVLA